MSDGVVQVVVGFVIGLSVWAVTALIGALAKRRADRVQLDATLQLQSGPDAVRQYGSAPCLAVRIACRGRRPAKIERVCLATALRRVDFTRQTDGANLSFVAGDGVRPTVSFDLLPLQERHNDRGWVLERDDVLRFLLPVQHPVIPFLQQAPSEDLVIEVHLIDGSVINVFSGLRLLDAIRQLSNQRADRPGRRVQAGDNSLAG